MRLERIAARGFKGLSLFPSGIAFDFDTLPPGLVAVVGPNGSGKTSWLELPLVALYGEFPSRPTNALIDAVDGRDAFVELEAVFEDRGTYRARVNVDGVGRATDAVLELTARDGAARRLNDGKISTYREAIARELPPLELVLASAFAAQGRTGSFATLGRKERKDLFAALLGLEHYEQLATTARTAAGAVDRRLEQVHGQVEALRPLTSETEEEAISETGNRLQAALTAEEIAQADQAARVKILAATVEQGRVRAARFIAADAEHRADVARRTLRVAERDRVAEETTGLDEDSARELAAIERRRDEAVRRLEASLATLQTAADLDASLARHLAAIDATLASKVAERQEKIANNQTILIDRAETIRAAASGLQALRTEIATLEQAERDGRDELETRVRLSTEAHAALVVAEQALVDAQRDARTAARMADVPCQGAGAYAACQFLADAAAARQRLEQTPIASRQTTAHAAAVRARHAVDAVDLQRAHLRTLAEQLTDRRQTAEGLRVDADRLSALQHAEARVAELQIEIRNLQAEAETARQEAHADRWRAQEAVDAIRARVEADRARAETLATEEASALALRTADRYDVLEARRAALDQEIATLDQQIAALAEVRDANAAAHAELLQAEADLAAAGAHLSGVDQRLARLEAEIEAFERRRAEFLARLSQRRHLEHATTALAADLVDWQALAKILGRDGLPVLEIDAAGPAVSALANDLLQACFGSRFTVELVTQEPKADGKGFKEVFELRVWDADRGADPRDLADLSGGEQVIVDEALKSAIALFVNQRNVLPLRTCWRDETIGALDPENAIRYIAMLRRLHERGGFHHTFVISHNLEAAALADAQILISDGRLTVRYPPFGAARAAA